MKALTYTSGEKIFAENAVYFGVGKNEGPHRNYPQAIIRDAPANQFSAQHSGLMQSVITVEIRQEIQIVDQSDEPGILFDQNRRLANGSAGAGTKGAGLESIAERVISQTNYLNADSNSAIKPFICNPRISEGPEFFDSYGRIVISYDALLER